MRRHCLQWDDAAILQASPSIPTPRHHLVQLRLLLAVCMYTPREASLLCPPPPPMRSTRTKRPRRFKPHKYAPQRERRSTQRTGAREEGEDLTSLFGPRVPRMKYTDKYQWYQEGRTFKSESGQDVGIQFAILEANVSCLDSRVSGERIGSLVFIIAGICMNSFHTGTRSKGL
jgi:hypothetical protein